MKAVKENIVIYGGNAMKMLRKRKYYIDLQGLLR